MNRNLILTAAIGLAALTSACTPAQVGRMITTHRKPAPAVVDHQPTVAPAATLIGDPPVQGPCAPGEVVVNGTCLPHGTDTPPSTQPPEDPNAPLSCPPGEVLDPDPTPHCIID